MNFKIPALVILIISIYQCSDKIRVACCPICGISFVIVVLIDCLNCLVMKRQLKGKIWESYLYTTLYQRMDTLKV